MLVVVKNLVKRYRDVLAVDNVSLGIEEGEIK
jgi:ABC-type multidrug transport system ATPase subunit